MQLQKFTLDCCFLAWRRVTQDVDCYSKMGSKNKIKLFLEPEQWTRGNAVFDFWPGLKQFCPFWEPKPILLIVLFELFFWWLFFALKGKWNNNNKEIKYIFLFKDCDLFEQQFFRIYLIYIYLIGSSVPIFANRKKKCKISLHPTVLLYYMKCSGENVILRGKVHVVSVFLYISCSIAEILIAFITG